MRKRFLSALLVLCMVLTLFPSVAVAVPAITVSTEEQLINAIADIDENGTITLGANIALTNTLTIDGTKSFTIDLSGYKLSRSGGVIKYTGTGTLTITDSSAGGGMVQATAFSTYAIESDGSGKLIVSGKAAVSSPYAAIYITGGIADRDVLEIAGGTVSSSGNYYAIRNNGSGNVAIAGGIITAYGGIASGSGKVTVSGGTVKSNFVFAIHAYGTVNIILTGGTVEGSGSNPAIYCQDSAKIIIPSGKVVIAGYGGAMNIAPDLTGYTSYQWRTTSSGTFTASTTQAYTYDSGHSYVEIKPYYTAPTSYTVAYHPGANGTGSEVTDTKTQDVALTLRGAIFNRGGFAQTGWATTDGGAKAYDLGGSYTANAAIDLYPVWTSGILVYTEAELISAITNVAEGGTIKLGANIALANTLAIGGTKSFVIDLNGNTLSRNGKVIEYSGTGALTITDSSADGGGSLETAAAFASAIESAGVGKLVISGKAAISSAYEAITILTPVTPKATVLEITDGTVVSTANSAISNNSAGQINVTGGTITGGNGIVSTGGGNVVVTDGTVTGTSGNAIRSDSGGIYGGTIIMTGGTIESTGSTCAIYCDASSNINIPFGSVIINGTAGAMNVAPNLTSYTSYQWRTSSTGEYTLSTMQAYTYAAGHTYVEIKPSTAPTSYTVAYHPGANGTGSEAVDAKTINVALTLRGAIFTRNGFTQTGWADTDGGVQNYTLGGSYTANAAITLYPVWTQNAPNTYTVTLPTGTGYTVAAQVGSSSPVTSGGSYSFTVSMNSGYHKGTDFAVKANGTPLTADGSGVYTLSNITQTQAVTVEGVVQDTTAASGGGHTSPAVTTVYNDPSIPNATVWISGNDLSRNDLLVTQSITSGSDYNALLKLADKDDVLRVYNITLQSGKKSTGSAMYLTFDLTGQYARQAFTLVHKKADGTFENLYATADKDGKVKFGPVYELSPFMLVKGSLLYVPTEEVVNAPKTGDASNSLLFVLLSLAAVCGAGMVVYRKKQA